MSDGGPPDAVTEAIAAATPAARAQAVPLASQRELQVIPGMTLLAIRACFAVLPLDKGRAGRATFFAGVVDGPDRRQLQ